MTSSNERLDTVHDLMEEILEIQRANSKDPAVIERVQEVIQKSSKLVENSKSPNEIIIDAKIFHTGSQVLSSSVTSFDTNLTTFNEEEYKKGILSHIRNNSSSGEFDKCWECLGSMTYHLFCKSVPAVYMLNSFSLEPPPPKVKEKAERTKKVTEAKTKLSQVSEGSKTHTDVEENIYECILKSLVKCYRENAKKPVLFIDFIMDPESYWRTVENIFYFSFLVRDKRVRMALNDNGLPVVEPILKSAESESQSQKDCNQFSFSLNQQEWRECIKKFGISTAKIPPFHKPEVEEE